MVGLVLITVIGLTGLIWLVDHGVSATLLLVVSGPTTTALGALGSLLVSTRTSAEAPQPVVGVQGGPVVTSEVPPKHR